MERLLFEILVYNRPIDKFNSYWEKKVSKFRCNETDEGWKDKKVIYKECYHRPTRWKNSVIGYINIYISGIDLITTLSIDARRKKFLEGAPDIFIDPSTFTRTRTYSNMSSTDILERFNSDLLDECKKRLKGHFVDFEAWNNTSIYIDWHELFYSKRDKNRARAFTSYIDFDTMLSIDDLPE